MDREASSQRETDGEQEIEGERNKERLEVLNRAVKMLSACLHRLKMKNESLIKKN